MLIEDHALMQTRTQNSELGAQNVAGRFGPFGGQYVPEVLMSALVDLEAAYEEAGRDDNMAR